MGVFRNLLCSLRVLLFYVYSMLRVYCLVQGHFRTEPATFRSQGQFSNRQATAASGSNSLTDKMNPDYVSVESGPYDSLNTPRGFDWHEIVIYFYFDSPILLTSRSIGASLDNTRLLAGRQRFMNLPLIWHLQVCTSAR